MTDAPSGHTLDALRTVVERKLPLRFSIGSIELATLDLTEFGASRCTPIGPFVLFEEALHLALRRTIADEPQDHRVIATVSAPPHWDDPRWPAYVEGWLDAVATVHEAHSVESLRPLRWRPWAASLPVDVLDEGSSAREFSEKFLEYPWLGRLLPSRPSKPPAYERAPRSAVMKGARVDLGRITSWIDHFTERTFVDHRWDDALLKAMPPEVRALDGVAMINAMVGGNGFEVFLAQARGATVRHCFAALKTVGATQLHGLMAEGIALAARQGAEFMNERNTRWVDAFDRGATSWDAIDGWDPDRTYALIESELMPKASEYADRHQRVLVRE
jgi:hypothetical protein